MQLIRADKSIAATYSRAMRHVKWVVPGYPVSVEKNGWERKNEQQNENNNVRIST